MSTYMYKKTCHKCDHENYFDRWMDFTDEAQKKWVDHIVDLDFIWQQTFECEECWQEHYSGDYDWYAE